MCQAVLQGHGVGNLHPVYSVRTERAAWDSIDIFSQLYRTSVCKSIIKKYEQYNLLANFVIS